MTQRRVVLAVLLLLVSGCATAVSYGRVPMPPRAQSVLMEVIGGGFTLKAGPEGLLLGRYVVSLQFRHHPHPPYFLVVTYENPSTPSAPLVHQHQVSLETPDIQLESDAVGPLQHGQHYAVHIQLYADVDHRVLLDELTQQLVYSLHPSALDILHRRP